MSDVRAKYVPPSVKETAFNCPHCGALARQFWLSLRAEPLPKKDQTPTRVNVDFAATHDFADITDPKQRERMKEWARGMASRRPFIQYDRQSSDYGICNADASRCFNCNELAIWVFDQIVWPRQGAAALPNPDMPEDIRRDYEEASTILDLSPRGAAALLRLATQNLLVLLGGKGDKIDIDIAALVRKGLSPVVQQALDVLRVVGNNAVHPGELDLRDDRATAEGLFRLINLIVEQMISQPRHVSEMYAALPDGARQAIERRDGKATQAK